MLSYSTRRSSDLGNRDGYQLPQGILRLQRSWPRPWRLKLRCRFLDAASNFPLSKINVRIFKYILETFKLRTPDRYQFPLVTLKIQRSLTRPLRLKLRCRFLDAFSF